MKCRLSYLMVVLLMSFVWTSVRANTLNITGSEFNGKVKNNTISMGGNHISFVMSGSSINYDDDKINLGDGPTSGTITWTPNSGCSVKVTSIKVYAYAYAVFDKRNFKLGTTEEDVHSAGAKGVSGSYTAVEVKNDNGLESGIFIGGTTSTKNHPYLIRQITIIYTVTPDAPSLKQSQESLNVSVDNGTTNSLNLTDYFTTGDHFDDYWNFSVSTNPNGGGFISGSTFYASKAGTYVVNGKINEVSGCHVASTATQFTIQVNRLPGEIKAKAASMTAKSTLDLSGCIVSSLGSGGVTYEITSPNKSSATISGSKFTPAASGDYTIKAVKSQDEQYTESSTTFVVSVNKISNSLTLSGDKSLYVDGTATGIYENKNSNASIEYKISDIEYQNESLNNGTGLISFDSAANKITALNAGTAKLTITQAQTEAYEGIENSIVVSVHKYNQSLSWASTDVPMTLVCGQTVNSAASSDIGLTVSYKSSEPGVLAVDDSGNVTALSPGTSVMSANQAGNYKYIQAGGLSRTFTVIDKYQPLFTPSFSGTQAALKVGETATITLANVTDGFSISAGTSGIVSWTQSGNTITLTALKEGSTTLTLNDPGNAVTNPASAVYTISVSKVDNTLDVGMSSLETTVGNTLPVTFEGKNNNDTPVVGTVSNQVLSSSVNNGSNVISYSDGVVTALNAGTATISFSQAATDKYTAAVQKSFDVTVTKNSNSISVTIDGTQRNSINLGHNASVPFAYSSASDAPFSVTMTSGSESIASISGNNIVSHSTDGSVHWEIVQAETYRFEKASTYIRVKVNSTEEAVGYVLNDSQEYTRSWEKGTIHQYSLSGPGQYVAYSAKKDGAAIYYALSVQCSNDGNIWTPIQKNEKLSSSYSDFTCEIPGDARYLRFQLEDSGQTLTKYIKNVTVTRRTYVNASSDKTDLGTVNTGSTGTATLTVDWSSTNGGDIAIESSNPNFAVSPAKITGTANKDGKTAVTVTYTPDPTKLGAESTTITVSDLFYTQELTLSATAAKQGTTITPNYDASAASSLKVDGTIANAFTFSGVSATTPSASSDADFHYTIAQHVSGSAAGSDHPDMVVTYDPTTNKVTALNAGTATLTIYQKSTSLYAATSASFEFSVAKHDQTVSWDKEDIDLILKKGQTFEDNTATASSELPVSYSSSNTLSITVDAASGVMTAVGAGADVTITASQEGNYKYNPASVSRKFTVYAQSTPVFTPSFEGTSASIKVDDTATITLENVSDGLDGDFIVKASAAGIVSWSRAENVLTVTALEAGEVKLTLSQKGNDDYLAKTSEYSLTVTLPDDYAVLDPSGELPSAGKYRKITLKRTIPAGLSTIALPFATTLEALAVGTSNAGAKAYVLKNVGVDSGKGYVFYFSEVTDGVLEAGVPYVVSLDSEVNAPVWRSEDGIQLTGNAGTITCGAWSIVANFTAGKSMTGLYGVVNSPDPSDGSKRINRIMKGGSGAVLNAYSASFEMAEADNSTGPAYSAPMQSGSAANKASGSDDTVEAVPLFSIPL